MAITKLSDVIVPELFNPYVVNRTMELSALFNSGIVTNNQEFNQLASEAAPIHNMPFFEDLQGESEPIIEDAGEHKTNNEYVFINLIDSSPKTNISNRSKSISIRDNSDYTPVLWNNFSFCTANNDMIN